MDSNFLKYLSTAPVLITVWLSFTAALIIEGNRFYPQNPKTPINLESRRFKHINILSFKSLCIFQ
jgi:photosystem I subunit 9